MSRRRSARDSPLPACCSSLWASIVFMQPHSSAPALTTAVLLVLLLAVYLLSRTAGLPGVGHGSSRSTRSGC